MAEGFDGILDFTGVPAGQPEFVAPPTPALPVGFYGLLDFTGIPTGQPQNVVARGGGTWAAGDRRRRLLQMMLLEQREREIEEESRRRAARHLKERLEREAEFAEEISRRQRVLTTVATYTTLFAEL
jgi:hypothetical protein